MCLTLSKYIFSRSKVLWENHSDGTKALDEPPKWNADWKVADKTAEWKLVTDFGVKRFPLKFGRTDMSKQQSIACVFEYR